MGLGPKIVDKLYVAKLPPQIFRYLIWAAGNEQGASGWLDFIGWPEAEL